MLRATPKAIASCAHVRKAFASRHKISERKLKYVFTHNQEMKMDADHRKALGIDDLMTVVHTDFKNQSRKGEDTDIDYYDVFAPDGTLIAKCEIHEAMGVYPPHNKRTIYKKYSPEGASLL